MKKLLGGICLLVGLLAAPICSANTGPYKIKMIDSLGSSTQKYITLDGYTNSACDNNRVLLYLSDAEQQKQVFVMLLTAFQGGYLVDMDVTTSNGQCYIQRVFMYR